MKGYRQFCGVAKALDIVGERWTLLVVRDLLLGPRRFSDLERSLPGITPNLLAKRLTLLRARGLIESVPMPERPSTRVYALTEDGRRLEAVVLALGAFGAHYLGAPAATERVDPRYAMLSLKRRYLGSPVAGTVALTFGEAHFTVRIGAATLAVCDGLPAHFDLRLGGPVSAWFLLFTRRARLSELEAQGELTRVGPKRLASAFIRCVGGRN